MKITDEDKELILKLDNIRQRGLYCSSNTLRDLYNRVFETNWKGTSCSSCMRQKISELMKALTKWEVNNAKNAAKKASESTKVAEVDNVPQEAKEAVTEEIKEAQDNAEEIEEEAEVENKVAEEATENTDVRNDKVIDTQDVTENKEAEQQPPEITEEKKDATVKRTSKKKSSRKKGG